MDIKFPLRIISIGKRFNKQYDRYFASTGIVECQFILAEESAN